MVSHEPVCIVFLITALNDLDIIATDIKNAYLNGPCDKKIWTRLGPEFHPELKGKWALVVQSLFGLKSAGAAPHYHLATCMEHLGFISCQVDPDVWLHKRLAESGHHFYKYVLIYTDDSQAIARDLHAILQ